MTHAGLNQAHQHASNGREVLIILIDHDNFAVQGVSVRSALRTITEAWSGQRPARNGDLVIIRAYGGWYEATRTSGSRHKAHAFYAEHLPTTFRTQGRIIRTSFQFADTLIPPYLKWCGPTNPLPITHTVALRNTPTYYRNRTTDTPCTQDNCGLRAMRRAISKRRACAEPSCSQPFGLLHERIEQKQVDSHLCADSLTLAFTAPTSIGFALLSDDWDMIPALAASAQQSLNPRFTAHARTSDTPCYADNHLSDIGITHIICHNDG